MLTANILSEAGDRIKELEAENATLRAEFANVLYDWLDDVTITDEQADYARKRIVELEERCQSESTG